MPRKSKDKIEDENAVVSRKTSNKSVKKIATKKVAIKSDAQKKSKKVTSKTDAQKKSKKVTPKTDAQKKAKETKKSPIKKSSTKKSNTALNKTSSKKVVKKTKSSSSRNEKVSTEEYYDLPNKYEQTIVKILAQTPTILFVYWEISSKDKNNFIKKYGENFFSETSPYLVVINKDRNYQFEVEINDYANSWYLHIPDCDCNYEVILIRKNKNSQLLPQNSITITSSNEIETPNDHILFERLGKTVFFKDVKSGYVQAKNIASFAFMHNIGRIYNIYDLYKEIYKNELNGDELGIKLSSSQFSSNFK